MNSARAASKTNLWAARLEKSVNFCLSSFLFLKTMKNDNRGIADVNRATIEARFRGEAKEVAWLWTSRPQKKLRMP